MSEYLLEKALRSFFLVDFLGKLPQVFRERYLQTHNYYLKSIADVIATMYHIIEFEEGSIRMIHKLLSQGAELGEKRQDHGDESLEFRNLRNSWYHECALNYPFDNRDERLRFASWKIIQCYYTVFSSIASLVCCYHKERKSVGKILNIYAREFLCNRKRKNFFLPPVNFHLNQQGAIPKELIEMVTWEYAHEHKIPYIKECLKSAYEENKITTIPHYLKSLRDWVTYQDSYLLLRLYGDSPRANLDFSLKRIAFIHCLQTEYYMISLFGWEPVKLQFDVFSTELKRNLRIESLSLLARFNAYKASSLFV